MALVAKPHWSPRARIRGICGFCLAAAVAGMLVDFGAGSASQLPTASEVQELKKRYHAELDTLVRSGADKRFLPNMFEHAATLASSAETAAKASRFLQAAAAFRQARWQLPYQGPGFPAHVGRVFGSLRLRHANEILAVAFSPDGQWLATGSRDCCVKIWDMANGHEVVAYRGHQRYVRAVAFSPDGKWIASAGGDKDIRIWDPQTGKDIRTLAGAGSHVTAMVISPDGKYVIAASDDRNLNIYDASTGQAKRTIADPGAFGAVRSLAFSPDGTRLAGGAENGLVRLWVYPDIVSANASEYWSQQDEEGSSNYLVFSPDNKFLVRCGPDALKIYDVQQPGGAAVSQGPRRVLVPPADPKNKTKLHHFGCAAFSKDAKNLFTGCSDGVIRLFEVDTGRDSGTCAGHNGAITGLALNAQGTQLASASTDYTVRLWDFDIVLEARDFVGHTEPIWAADFSPDGQRIISSGADRSLRAWDAGTGLALRTIGEHSAGLTTARFSPDGKKVLVGGGQSILRLYEADSGKLVQSFEGHAGTVTSVAFSREGAKIASGGADKTVIIWTTATGKAAAKINADSMVMAVAFTPEGKQVVAGCSDQRIRFFDADSGKPGPVWTAHNGAVSGLSFDAKGEWLATCGFDGLVKIWKLNAPAVAVDTLAGHEGPLSAVAFRPDGKFLVSAGSDHVVKLWKNDKGTFKEAQVFRGHKDWITSLAFNNNGFLVLSASADRTIKVWELASRELILTAEHTGAVQSAAISPDGALLASGATDKTIKLWDASTGKEIRTITAQGASVVALAFSPDGKTLFSSGGDGDRNIRRWDVVNGQELKPLANQENLSNFINAVPQLAVRPDGKRLIVWIPFDERGTRVASFETATAADKWQINYRGKHVLAVAWTIDQSLVAFAAKDGAVRIYDVREDKVEKEPPDLQLTKDVAVTALAFAPDGAKLYVGCADGQLLVVDPRQVGEPRKFGQHAKGIHRIAASPDGKRIATVGLDNCVKVWDAAGKELRNWPMPAVGPDQHGLVTQLIFTPDGRYIVTANANTTLFMLQVP